MITYVYTHKRPLRDVRSAMLPAVCKLQVLNTIVKFIAVDMMHYLTRRKFSSDMLLHDQPMLKLIGVCGHPDALIAMAYIPSPIRLAYSPLKALRYLIEGILARVLPLERVAVSPSLTPGVDTMPLSEVTECRDVYPEEVSNFLVGHLTSIIELLVLFGVSFSRTRSVFHTSHYSRSLTYY